MNLPKSVKNYNLMREGSYANSVLQALIQLECFQEWVKLLGYNGNINSPFFNSSLTKDLYLLFCNLPMGLLDSSKLILDFDVSSQNIWHKDISRDPFHFLFYFLEILHYETNIPKNSMFNLNVHNQKLFNNIKSDIESLKLFREYLTETQNSFTSNNFFNIEKNCITCPNCQIMYNYSFKKIIRFNVDELLFIRNQSNQLKIGYPISLNECFQYSAIPKRIQCQVCSNFLANEIKGIYEPANVLIISFNRYNHSINYQCDVKFYVEFNISRFLVNKESENVKYKLKAVIACYGNNKYYADVFINGYYYRIMDTQSYPDVKIIDINRLCDFEPVLLIYEIDYQDRTLKKMKKLFTFAFQQNLQQIMQQNISLLNVNQGFQMNNNFENNNQNFIDKFINLQFLVIPENWNGSQNDSFPITPQVTSQSTVQYAIGKFYSKLQKPKEAIIKFTYNNINLDVNSQQKLCDLNINENTIIYALKAQNFDLINF